LVVNCLRKSSRKDSRQDRIFGIVLNFMININKNISILARSPPTSSPPLSSS